MAEDQTDLQAFYAAAGGDYDLVLGRLRDAARVEKFLRLFFRVDKNYEKLMEGVETGDADKCFAAAHTLKGSAGDVGLTTLSERASEACEGFRDLVFTQGLPLVPAVTEAYERVQQAADTYL